MDSEFAPCLSDRQTARWTVGLFYWNVSVLRSALQMVKDPCGCGRVELQLEEWKGVACHGLWSHVFVQRESSNRCTMTMASTDSQTLLDEQIQLPLLKYGYRTVSLEWNEVVHIINVEGDLDKLTRSEKQQREYMIYTRRIKEEWRSVMDYVLYTKFGLEKMMDGRDNRWYVYPPLSEITGVHTRIVRNDFPYCFQRNIEHWVLWKIGEDCSESDITAAKDSIRKDLENVRDFIHWINPPHLKSLPEVDHAHILVLRDDASF